MTNFEWVMLIVNIVMILRRLHRLESKVEKLEEKNGEQEC